MKSKHQIRLQGPWQAKVVESVSHQKLEGATLKVRFAGLEESAAAFDGKVNLYRGFNRPTGLNEDSTVTLCIEGFNDHTTFFFNQAQLSATAGSEGDLKQYHVGDQLLAFNQIELRLLCPPGLIQALPSPKVGVSPTVAVTQDQEVLVVAGRVWLEIC